MPFGSTSSQTSFQLQDTVHEGISALVQQPADADALVQQPADADLQEQVSALETEKVHTTATSYTM